MDAVAEGSVVLCVAFFTAFLVTSVSLWFFRKEQQKLDNASVLIVVGSGGHTKEILMLTEKLGAQYSPRHYVVASTDSISLKKIIKSEKTASGAANSKSEILCNGPGTCVPICYAGLLLKWLGLADTRIVYVESICRVETLSLSAKLLYPFADSLVVQWPTLVEKYPQCKYIGRFF